LIVSGIPTRMQRLMRRRPARSSAAIVTFACLRGLATLEV
jgi:hypothetical protein